MEAQNSCFSVGQDFAYLPFRPGPTEKAKGVGKTVVDDIDTKLREARRSKTHHGADWQCDNIHLENANYCKECIATFAEVILNVFRLETQHKGIKQAKGLKSQNSEPKVPASIRSASPN